MKAVGEVMAIGRTFEEALGKAMRSLENGRCGLGADGKRRTKRCGQRRGAGRPGGAPHGRPHLLPGRGPAPRLDAWSARARGHAASTRSSWRRMADVVRCAGEPARHAPGRAGRRRVPPAQAIRPLRRADRRTSPAPTSSPCARAARCCTWCPRSRPWTPAPPSSPATRPTTTRPTTLCETRGGCPRRASRAMILGAGPNRIGQGIEFDYCCVHASATRWREAGLRAPSW